MVTATEIKTSSILVTPEPTWKIETITIQPTQAQQQIAPLLLQTSAIQIQDHQKFFLPGIFLIWVEYKRKNYNSSNDFRYPQDFQSEKT